MNRKKKTAEFLADCLGHMPDQPKQLQRAIDTIIAGLKRIGSGGEWPEEEAMAAARTAMAVADAADCAAAARTAMAAAWAADAVADWAAVYWGAAYWAALAHPDPDAERERQKAKRKELGL